MGTIDVYKTDAVFGDKSLTWESHDPERGYDAIMQIVEGHCIALKDGKCSIYEKRPAVCRAFQVGCSCCENIRLGYLNAHTCGFCKVSDALQQAMKQKEPEVKKPSRELDEKEKAKGRSSDYWDMDPRDQWAEDKRLGILDWDGN
jgi:Fe-S-cluster containining protein